MYFYGPGCIDDADAQAFNWTMWDAYQDEMKRQEELAIEHFKQQVEAAKRGELVPAPQPVSVINWQSIPRPPSKQYVGVCGEFQHYTLCTLHPLHTAPFAHCTL